MGTCGANVCTCPNGTPVVAVGTGGTFCGANADVDCSACNPGYSLSVTPAADTLSTCPANICTCPNGSPSVAAGAGATLCETDADVDCSACNVGYSPSVTPAAGTLSTCVANQCAATEVANSVDHSSSGAITGSTRDTVTVVCEAGYYELNATPDAPGITTCGTDGSFDTLTCGANVCTCPNGTPVVAVGTGGTLCEADADVDCSACNPGYSPSITPAADTLSTCEANICTCPNGTPVVFDGTGAALCEQDADVDCSACDAGYYPSVTPAADTLSTCEANVCTCLNGTPSVAVGTGGTLCEADADVDCSACDTGYSLSVTPAAGTLSTCH